MLLEECMSVIAQIYIANDKEIKSRRGLLRRYP